MFTPCEVFCDKKAKKSGDADRDSLKSAYFKLSEKKALKFIKKAEKKYDDYVGVFFRRDKKNDFSNRKTLIYVSKRRILTKFYHHSAII
jgi:hypothetical protein